jgi:hypothetical protein
MATKDLTEALSSPKRAFEYAHEVIKDRWPSGEDIIAQDSQWAYWYARFVIKDRWPEAEPIIAQDAFWAYCFALFVI